MDVAGYWHRQLAKTPRREAWDYGYQLAAIRAGIPSMLYFWLGKDAEAFA